MLADLIAKSSNKSGLIFDGEVINCALLYRNEAVRGQLEASIRYHGMGGLYSCAYDDKYSDSTLESLKYPVLFIEIGDDLEEVERWRYLLSHESRVILIGLKNDIATMRTVEQLGFYYLPWPADEELIDWTLKSIRDDQLENRGPQQVRKAMRMAVVSMKGGSGCTMIATELCHVLASATQKQVILVDHNYRSGNQSGMGVMLGRETLERHRLTDNDLGHSVMSQMLDQLNVQSQLRRIDPLISYLGVEADWGRSEELWEYNNQLLVSLAREANFVIEDYSASVDFSVDPNWLCELMNCIVIVVDANIASLMQTRPYLEKLQRVNDLQRYPARILLVLNNTRSHSALDRKMVEKYLERSVTVELPWVRRCDEQLLDKRRFYNARSPLTLPFRNLGQAILGKPMSSPSLFERIKVQLSW